jgi:allantoinase
MKRTDEGRFDLAWGGIASLSVALSAVWTGSMRRGFSLDDLARWMSSAPAWFAGFSDRAGIFAHGREASFVVFDPEAEFQPASGDLHTRHAISPYVGESLLGRVEATYMRGAAVYQRQTRGASPQFAKAASGREQRAEASAR